MYNTVKRVVVVSLNPKVYVFELQKDFVILKGKYLLQTGLGLMAMLKISSCYS